MSDTTIIQQLATQLYTGLKIEVEASKNFVSKPNAFLFSMILTKVASCVESYKANGKNLTSAEKQSVAIEIGRLWITDLKGTDSPDVAEYNILAVPMLDMLIDFSNCLVILGNKLEAKCKTFSCFNKCMKN